MANSAEISWERFCAVIWVGDSEEAMNIFQVKIRDELVLQLTGTPSVDLSGIAATCRKKISIKSDHSAI
ncbi:MAG: hypothetical protein RLZZ458_2232 [Planctomycetota bacterium]